MVGREGKERKQDTIILSSALPLQGHRKGQTEAAGVSPDLDNHTIILN